MEICKQLSSNHSLKSRHVFVYDMVCKIGPITQPTHGARN